MRPQTIGSNTLSGSIICPSVCLSVQLFAVLLKFFICINFKYGGPALRCNYFEVLNYWMSSINASRHWNLHCKWIQIQKPKKARISYFHSGDLTLWPAAERTACNYGTYYFFPKSDADNQKERWTVRHIISTGPHWGPEDPSVDIITSRRWTPTLEINTNKKNSKGLWTTGRTDGQTYYTCTLGILNRGLRKHALHAIAGHELWSSKIDAGYQTEKQIDKYIYKHISSTGYQGGVIILNESLRRKKSF